MKHYLLLLLGLSIALTSCSKDEEATGNPPGLFSTNTTALSFNGATIEWTESIDPDDNEVTYAIILENQEIDSEINVLTYSFSNLEPNILYNGYVEARDDNGNTSQADFFFTTLPETLVYNSDLTFVEFDIPTSVACSGGVTTGYEIDMGVLVPKHDGNVAYLVEFSEFTLPNNGGSFNPPNRSWSNDNFDDYYIYDFNETHWFVWGSGAAYSCSNDSDIPAAIETFSNIEGSADITITFLDEG